MAGVAQRDVEGDLSHGVSGEPAEGSFDLTRYSTGPAPQAMESGGRVKASSVGWASPRGPSRGRHIWTSQGN